MKKLLLFASVMFAANLSRAQWEPDVRLTNDPFASTTTLSNSVHAIATSGDTVHVIWDDNRDGNYEIYYKRSVDGGLTWGTDTRLTNASASSRYPSITVSGSFVHVAWCDYRDSDWEIYYKRSTDGGNSWGTDTRLSYSVGNTWHPAIAVSGEYVHLVYYDYCNGWWDIFYKRSTDGGLTWEPEVRLTNDPGGSYWPSICATGPDVHVAWYDGRDGNREIYYKRSTDYGSTWGEDTRLTNDPAVSWYPCISVHGSVLHVVWRDDRNGNSGIYYKRSTDGGVSWGADTWLTNSFSDGVGPSLAVSGSAVHIVWYDDRDGDLEIYYKKSEDEGLNWGTNTRLTNALGDSEYPSIEVSGPMVHVVWTDLRDGNEEIYYKRNPTGGFPVGVDNELAGNSGQPITIYPNPACTVLNIDFNSASDENLDVRIINIFGQTIGIYKFNSSKGLNQYKTDLNDLSNGLYLIEFTSGEQKQFKKLLIRK